MSKFLINESPLVILPTLASAIGLSEAIVLQQIQYWISNPKAGVVKDGFKWVYNSYENWQKENFPFWTASGVEKIFIRLEKAGLLVSKQLSESVWDRTKYYRIDYDKLGEAVAPFSSVGVIDDPQKVDSTYNRDYSETTNTAAEEKASSLPENLPYDWQIAANVKEIKAYDDKHAQYKDSANLIAQGTGSLHHRIYDIAFAFQVTRELLLPFEDAKTNRTAARKMAKLNVQPHNIVNAVRYLADKGWTCTDLFSVAKIAIEDANPTKANDFSQPQYNKFEE